MPDEFAADVASVAALNEPVRRALYRYVVTRNRPIGREEAAAGVGVAHHVAKFNLDRLVADGLLEVEHRRPPGRAGPGAGRPAKLYRRAARDIAVSLPERHYDLAGQVLAEALTLAARDALPVDDALRVAARATGHRLADAAGSAPVATPQQAVCELLTSHGYEPHITADGVFLANCPFHNLAQTHRQLVCGMNLHLVHGIVERVCPGRLQPRMTPGPDRCCVSIHDMP